MKRQRDKYKLQGKYYMSYAHILLHSLISTFSMPYINVLYAYSLYRGDGVTALFSPVYEIAYVPRST